MIAHCLFEQSGTFRDEFRKMGIESYDYDIANDYGKTDHIVDLFEEIRGGTKERKVSLTKSKKKTSSWLSSLAPGSNVNVLCLFVEKHSKCEIGRTNRDWNMT